MEKRISFFQFQSVRNVAKAIDPKLKERAALQKKAVLLKQELDVKKAKLQEEIDRKTSALKAEFDACEQQINLLEAGIVQTLGFHVSDVVKKVIEPTGKTDPKTGKALTVTKYVETDNVHYDKEKKEYVITISDGEEASESFQSNEGTAAEESSETPAEGGEVSMGPESQPQAEETAEGSGNDAGLPWDNQ